MNTTLADTQTIEAQLRLTNGQLQAREEELKATCARLAALVESLRDKDERLHKAYTRFRNTARALKETEKRYERLVRATHGFIFTVIVRDGKAVNTIHYPGTAEVTGYTAQDYETDPLLWYRMIHEEDRALVLAHIERVLRGDSPPAIEHRIRHKDQSVRWIHNMSIPRRDRQGQVVAYDGLIVDVSDRKRAEAERDRLLLDVRRSNAELEQFAYVASHDLQEPLRMIAGYMQLLSSRYRGRLDADADEFIQFAVDGATRMQAMIHDLLRCSRAGTQALERHPIDLQEIVPLALANLRVMIEQTGATVTWDRLPTVIADPIQLTQLFQNLIGNAIKFHGERSPRVHIAVRRANGDWQLSVQDNGIGFDPRHAERAFMMFQRLHAREKYDGTGIGLTICRKIVERHGGRIWAESAPGQGSTFFFTLPATLRRIAEGGGA